MEAKLRPWPDPRDGVVNVAHTRQIASDPCHPHEGWWTEQRRESVGAIAGAVLTLIVAKLLNPEPSGYGTHEHLFLLPCIFKLLTGLPCPFCGMTTSFALMADGAVRAALGAHILGPPAYLATWAILPAALAGLVGNRPPLPRWLFSQRAGRILLVVVLVGWVFNLVRFLGGF